MHVSEQKIKSKAKGIENCGRGKTIFFFFGELSVFPLLFFLLQQFNTCIVSQRVCSTGDCIDRVDSCLTNRLHARCNIADKVARMGGIVNHCARGRNDRVAYTAAHAGDGVGGGVRDFVQPDGVCGSVVSEAMCSVGDGVCHCGHGCDSE